MLMNMNRFCHACLKMGTRTGGVQMLLQQQWGQQIRKSSLTTLQKEAAKFFEKHTHRASPQSPYMLGLAYKFQLTSLLSITHRITGLGLGLVVYGMGIVALSQSKLSYEQILLKIKEAVPEALITGFKFIVGMLCSREPNINNLI